MALLGLLIEYAGIRRLYAAGHDYQLLFTFGLALILNELIILIWGPVGISHLPPAILRGGVDLGFTFYPKYRLFVMVMAGLLVLATWLFLEKTRYGAIMRAGIENKEMVSLLGIDIHGCSPSPSRSARSSPASPARSPRRSAASSPGWAWTCSASPSWWWRSAAWATCSAPSPPGC